MSETINKDLTWLSHQQSDTAACGCPYVHSTCADAVCLNSLCNFDLNTDNTWSIRETKVLMIDIAEC